MSPPVQQATVIPTSLNITAMQQHQQQTAPNVSIMQAPTTIQNHITVSSTSGTDLAHMQHYQAAMSLEQMSGQMTIDPGQAHAGKLRYMLQSGALLESCSHPTKKIPNLNPIVMSAYSLKDVSGQPLVVGSMPVMQQQIATPQQLQQQGLAAAPQFVPIEAHKNYTTYNPNTGQQGLDGTDFNTG